MYTGACAGQNINIKTAFTFLKLVQYPSLAVEAIDYKLLILAVPVVQLTSILAL